MGWKDGSTWRRRSCRRFMMQRLADANLEVRTEDAYRLVKRLAREEGLLLSPSAAAALVGCFQVARRSRRRARGDRYHFPGLGQKIFERAFLGRSLSVGRSLRMSRRTLRERNSRSRREGLSARMLRRDAWNAMATASGRAKLQRSVSADQSARRFAAQPLFDYAGGFSRGRARRAERGLDLLGWYHSHPDHPARPSEFDREHAWPWYSYVIVSVRERRAAGIDFLAARG